MNKDFGRDLNRTRQNIEDLIFITLIAGFAILGAFFITTVAVQLIFGPVKIVYCPVNESCSLYLIGRFVFGLFLFLFAGLTTYVANLNNERRFLN